MLMGCYKTESIDDVKELEDSTVSIMSQPEPYAISKDEVLLLTIEIDSLNISEAEFIGCIKPCVDYYFDPHGNLFIQHDDKFPDIDDKILCATRIHESHIIEKSCENTLVIETGYLPIDNEVFEKVPSIEYITVKSLKNGVAEVEYNNMTKLIHPNETLYDVIPFEINNKKYTIRLTIRNFGLVRKDSIKKG